MDSVERFANQIPFVPKGPGISARLILSYVFDYLIIIVLAVVYAIIDKVVTPFSQHFSLTDITIQYPFSVKERIPIYLALVISFACPAVVIAVYTLVIDGLFSQHRQTTGTRSKYTLKQRLWELNCGLLGLCLAQGAAFVVTGTFKNLYGRPRPDLISRCLPRAGSLDPPVFGLSTREICLQTDAAIMQDGFRSFPSGHSSSSFAGLFYLSLYLAAKLHVLDQRGEVWRTVIVIIPVVAASCIAISRIMDYRHHPEDVLFGSVLGVLCAWGSYRQYFPPVTHSWLKGRAYPMRTWGKPLRRPDRTTEVMHEDTTYEGQNIGLEPLRSSNPAYRDSQPEPPPRTESGNVFRDEILRSQQMRSEGDVHDPGHDSSNDEDDIGYHRPMQRGLSD